MNRIRTFTMGARGMLALFILLVVAWPFFAAHAKDEKKKRPKPIVGIRWELDFAKGMERAQRRGLPILFAINALEDERANVYLATEAYRSKEWGEASRGYVCFVCNPNDHDGPDGRCKRYPGTTTQCRKDALNYVLKRFTDSPISPQHIILEPDGTLAYRKEYFTGVVGPKLLESKLAEIVPAIAVHRASVARESKIKSVRKGSVEELTGRATAWLNSGDPLALGGLLTMLDDEQDAVPRLAIRKALASTPKRYAHGLWHGASLFVPYPDEEPDTTKAWVKTLIQAKRSLGVWAAAMAVARTEDAKLRNELLALWSGKDEEGAVSVDAIPQAERARALEALALAGDPRGKRVDSPFTATEQDDWPVRLRRAWNTSTQATSTPATSHDEFVDILAGKDTEAKVRALASAKSSSVGSQSIVLLKMLRDARHDPLRRSAAVALLRAKVLGEQGAVHTAVAEALLDPIEGRATKLALKDMLKGVDLDSDDEMWLSALASYVATLAKGGAK